MSGGGFNYVQGMLDDEDRVFEKDTYELLDSMTTWLVNSGEKDAANIVAKLASELRQITTRKKSANKIGYLYIIRAGISGMRH